MNLTGVHFGCVMSWQFVVMADFAVVIHNFGLVTYYF